MERWTPGRRQQPCSRRHVARAAAPSAPWWEPSWSPRPSSLRLARPRWPPHRRCARPPCGPAPARTARPWRRPGVSCARMAARQCAAGAAEAEARRQPPAVTCRFATGMPACRRRHGGRLPAQRARSRRAPCFGATPCAACRGDDRPQRAGAFAMAGSVAALDFPLSRAHMRLEPGTAAPSAGAPGVGRFEGLPSLGDPLPLSGEGTDRR